MTKAEIKKFVKEHKKEIIVGGVALVVGVKLGSNHTAHEYAKGINRAYEKSDYLKASLRMSKSFVKDLGKLMVDANSGIIVTPDTKTTIKQALTDISTDESYKWLNSNCRGLVIFS